MVKKNRGALALLLAAFIWGATFVAQRSGMDRVGPFNFLATRSVLTALVLLPFGLPRLLRLDPKIRRATLLGGAACGGTLYLASALQQVGIVTTSAGKAGFLTALYIIFVPLLRRLGGKKATWTVWSAVGLAAVGLYFLCTGGEAFVFRAGDLLVLLSALAFAAQILIINHVAPQTDGIVLSWLQFCTCAVLGVSVMAFTEPLDLSGLRAAWFPIFYAGVFSGAIAYTLQILGQKRTEPTVAALLMSLEAVFSVLSGWLLLQETLSAWELGGCALVFAAVVLAQVPTRSNVK